MGILDAIFNPTKNQDRAFSEAQKGLGKTRRRVDPFFADTVSQGRDANKLKADLLGLNGPEAQQAAQQFYANNPAAQIALERGIEAIDASASAKGQGFGGDTLRALNEFGMENHQLNRQQYLNNLSGVGQQGFQGAQGLLGTSNATANLGIQAGGSRDAGNAGALGNVLNIGSMVAGMATGMPTGSLSKPQQIGRVPNNSNPYFANQAPITSIKGFETGSLY